MTLYILIEMNEETISVSIGELLDKLSILKIKKNKIKDCLKLRYINSEFLHINEKSTEYLKNPKVKKLFKKIYKTNKILWDLEDKIRKKEKQNKFNNKFIEISIKICETNDLRFVIKNKINQITNSKYKEQKDYSV
jgi:hypothetical protein